MLSGQNYPLSFLEIYMKYIILICSIGLFLSSCQRLNSPDFFNLTPGDNVITQRVQTAFAQTPRLEKAPIDVSVEHGIVSLSGFVKTIRQSDTAESVATQVEGVKQVENNLIVRK
tara:strand:- start:447 stop:791 length:345 start_codon:yes stop_codon:yes gene_type:complete